ncbi:mating-type switching protein swi10-like isoform X2 [Monomorium pharaonis]|uniref:mating-type switching protein swi10-like isoform X2 n=1 Tax=Monomorium pharaonis TaxID=307658 RepID=UPI001746B360|nr:mating-type switching protein swi10-like isoform X2 [Monomorium pharaonis]
MKIQKIWMYPLQNKLKIHLSKPETSVAAALSKINTILVNVKQRGNPLLKFITNVSWEYSDIVPDYVMGKTTCALFLSIRYHQLNPDYIHERLKLLNNTYNLRVLLVQIDVADPHHALKHLTRISILADMTLMLAWNAEDAGKIIETYKIYENKPPDDIMERSDTAPHQKLTGDQIRWKFSALKKSYNKKRDHNRTSGNAPKALDEFEERIKEIIGDKSGDAIKENSFNSPLLKRTSLNQSQEQNIILLENVDIEKKINDIQNNIKINQMRKHDIPEIDSENINIEETINSG